MRFGLIHGTGRLLAALGLLSLLLAHSGAAAGITVYALVIFPESDNEPMVLTDLKIGGKGALRTFGERAAPPTLLRRDYARMQKIALFEFRRILFVDGVIVGEALSGEQHALLPEGIKAWPRSAATTARIPELLRDIRFTGKRLGIKKKHAGRFREGMVIYFYPASPRPDEIAFAQVELDGTRAAHQRFLENYPESPHVIDARAVLSGDLGDEVLAVLDEYEKAWKNKTTGYANLDKARELIRRLEVMGAGDPKVAEARTRLKQYDEEIEHIREHARTALERNEFTEALRILAPAEHFRPELPALDEETTAIRRAAFQYFLVRGDHFSIEAKFDAARTAADRAEKWGNTAELAELRAKIVTREEEYKRRRELERSAATANTAVRRGDYLTALKLLNSLVAANPGNTDLQERRSFARRKLRGELLTQAPSIEQTYTPIKQGNLAGEKAVLEFYLGLAVLAAADTSDAEAVYWRDTIRDYLAEYYLGRAYALTPTVNILPSGLAYAFLQQAYTLTPVSGRPDIKEMPAWRRQVEGRLGLQLKLNIQDATSQRTARAAARQLRGLLTSKLQQGGMPNLRILAENARPSDDALELHVDIMRTSVQDAKQTEIIASERTEGSRQVLNSEWERAKVSYDESVIEYEKLRAGRKKKMNKRKKEEHEAASDAALSRMNDARKILDETPTYSQENDIRPYSISRNTVTRTISVGIAYRWVKDGIILETKTASHDESATGVEIIGADPADRNGHTNQQAALPSIPDLLGRAITAMHEPLAAEFAIDLAEQISNDYEQARRFASRSNSIQAADHFLRYLYNSPTSDPRRKEAIEYLEKEFNLLTLDSWLVVTVSSAGN